MQHWQLYVRVESCHGAAWIVVIFHLWVAIIQPAWRGAAWVIGIDKLSYALPRLRGDHDRFSLATPPIGQTTVPHSPVAHRWISLQSLPCFLIDRILQALLIKSDLISWFVFRQWWGIWLIRTGKELSHRWRSSPLTEPKYQRLPLDVFYSYFPSFLIWCFA